MTPTAFLAQVSNPLLVPDPAPLPEGSFVKWALLENPWPGAILMLAAAGVCWIVLNGRGNPRGARTWAGGFGALAAGLFALASLVTTTNERLKSAARSLVRSVADADASGVRALLTNDAALYWWQNPDGLPFSEILDRVSRDFAAGGQYRLSDVAILDTQACLDEPARGRVQIKVRATPDASGFPVISWWRLDYQLQSDGSWRVRGIQPLAISGVSNPTGR